MNLSIFAACLCCILAGAECFLICRQRTAAKRLSETERQLENAAAALDSLEDRVEELEELTRLQRQALDEKSKALVDYADTAAAASAKEVYDRAQEERTEAIFRLSKTIDQRFEDLLKRVEKLESGMVPDYEEALKAAKAVNDFNTGLSAIMNFDPMEEARKARSKAAVTGGERYGV